MGLKFSVVTATLNSERTLERCLASVAGQKGVELEHLVVDGGSNDGTLEILKGSGVRFVSEPDRGVYDAFNKGLALASGQIVSFLGSDDFYLEGALASVESVFASKPGAQCVHGDILVGEREVKPPAGFESLGGARLLHPATFMRKDLLDSLGGFDVRFKIVADLDLFLRARRRCSFIWLDKPLTGFTLGGLSTRRLGATAVEIRRALLKNGLGELQADAHFALALARAAASPLKRAFFSR